MNLSPARASFLRDRSAFTLVELVVTMLVLVLMMVLISQIFNSTSILTSEGNKHMDADAQARAVFDRMAIDFAQTIKRPDVDYFLKDPNTPQLGNPPASGNDQMAFYSQVPGYTFSGTAAGVPSPVSLVAYRVNSNTASPYYNQLQRYGFGLVWNGVTATGTAAMPVIFSVASTTSLPNTISTGWPNATNMTTAMPDDPNYEALGPDVFRFEYFYVLRGQTINGQIFASELSDTPWDSRITGITGVVSHTSVNGMQDVAAIGVVIAVIDPKSRMLVSNSQLSTLASQLPDFPQTNASGINSTQPGYLETQWESAISSTANGLPRVVTSAIRVYKRYFYLSQTTGVPP